MASRSVVISRHQNLWGRTFAQFFRALGPWLYVILMLGLITAMAFVYLYQASYVALQIDRMALLEQRLDELHEQNSALLLRIATYEDISRIKTEARAMGLGEAAHIEYVQVELGGAPAGDNVAQQSPTGSNYSAQPSSMLDDEASPATGGSWVASAIVKQFEGWIGRGTAVRGAE